MTRLRIVSLPHDASGSLFVPAKPRFMIVMDQVPATLLGGSDTIGTDGYSADGCSGYGPVFRDALRESSGAAALIVTPDTIDLPTPGETYYLPQAADDGAEPQCRGAARACADQYPGGGPVPVELEQRPPARGHAEGERAAAAAD